MAFQEMEILEVNLRAGHLEFGKMLLCSTGGHPVSKITLVWLMALFIQPFTVFASDDSSDWDGPISLQRPEISIPVFGLMRRANSSLNLQKLDSQIDASVEAGNSELESVVLVSNELGGRLLKTTIPSDMPELIPIPSLLVVSATGKPGYGGALVLVEAKSESYLQIYDVQGGRGRGYLHFGDLQMIWSGEALVLNAGDTQSQFYAVGTLLLLILFGILATVSRQSARKVSICLACCLLFAGCSNNSQPSKWPISTLDSSIAELGLLHGDDLNTADFSIPLMVNHPGELKIVSVVGNCSCMSIGEDLVGTSRKGGEKFDFRGKLRLDGKIGEDLLVIQFQTSDGEDLLPMSKIGIRFRSEPRPTLNVNRVELSGYEGDSQLKGEFSIVLVRQQSDRPLSIDENRIETGNVVFHVLSSLQAQQIEDSDLVRDTMRIELSLDGNELAMEPQQICFAANGYDRLFKIPVSTKVQNEFLLKPSKLFLGVLEPKCSVNKTIVIERTIGDPSLLEKMSLVAPNPNLRARLVETELVENKAIVTLGFEPIDQSGRGTADISIQLDDQSTINVPVSWVMQ